MCSILDREKSKGFNIGNYMIYESMEHISKCKQAEEFLEEKWLRTVERKRLRQGGEKCRKRIIKLLKGHPVCRYSKKFEDIARSRTEKREESEA